MRLWFVFALITELVLCASTEPSAFELQSGVTKKDVKDLRTSSQHVQSLVGDLQANINGLKEGIDGLRSLYDGLVASVRQNSSDIKVQSGKLESLKNSLDSYKITQDGNLEAINSLKSKTETNSESIAELDKKVDKLADSLLKANEAILSQLSALSDQAKLLQDNATSLQSKLSDFDKNGAGTGTKSPQETPSAEGVDLSKIPVKKVKSDASKLYRENKLEEASKYYSWLVDKGHHKAESNFYLGEIAYKQKKYDLALSHYKISVTIDDKATYMPVLLWHTAWSFRYLGDIDGYNKFIDALILAYPNSEQGVKAVGLKKKSKQK